MCHCLLTVIIPAGEHSKTFSTSTTTLYPSVHSKKVYEEGVLEIEQGPQMFGHGPHPNLMTGAQNAPQHNKNPHLICPAVLKQCYKKNVLCLSLASIVKSWCEGLTLGSTDSLGNSTYLHWLIG